MQPSKSIKLVKILLFLSAVSLVVIAPNAIYPFVTPKILLYRSLIESALIVFFFFIISSFYRKDDKALNEVFYRARIIFRNPLFLTVVAFLVSAIFSSLFAVDGFRSFFGNLERGEGVWGLLHYGVFLFLGLLVFRRDDWIKFAKIILAAASFLIVWSWLQFSLSNTGSLAESILSFLFSGAQLGQFKELIGSSFQPGSFVGNPGSLAAFIVISVGLAVFAYFNSHNNRFRRVYLLFAAASLITVFLTGIRGAALGVSVGLLFLFLYLLFKNKGLGVRWPALVLIALILFGGAFWFTRTNSFWQRLPGFNRFATVSAESSSVSTRLIALGVSRDAFLEKPVFGWGPENYNIAYNKHYNPDYSYYAEDWFDRAHNKVAEVGVTQGVVGLAAYLGIFVFLFRELFRKKPDGYAFVAAALVAYFVQNLFLFDNITSYIPFFTVIGMTIAFTTEEQSTEREFVVVPLSSGKLIAAGALSAVLVLGSFYSLYVYNFLPWYQATEFVKAVSTKVGEKILSASDQFLYPYNFAQKEIRTEFAQVLYDNNLLGNENFKSLVDKSVSALEEVAQKEPYDPRTFALLTEIYNELSRNTPSLLEKSEEYARQAVALSPENQNLNSQLAVTLAGTEKTEEAVRIARELVSRNEGLAKAHYHLALVLALAAERPENWGTPLRGEYRTEAEQELDIARDIAWGDLGYDAIYYGPDLAATQAYLFNERDLNNMAVIYRLWAQPAKEADVLKMLIWLDFWHGDKNPDYYYAAIRAYRELRDKEGILTVARQLKSADSRHADDMETIIDLTEKEKWNILDNL